MLGHAAPAPLDRLTRLWDARLPISAGKSLADRAGRRLRRIRPLAPSLYDVHPGADSLPRLAPYLTTVSAAQVIGTVRHPSTIDTTFLPVESLRTANWKFRAARIRDAMDQLVDLPPVTLFEVDDRYYVVDGHHRVEAAKRIGADLDAYVTRLQVAKRSPAD
jgi:hypothetical protein